jgi:hypothetical protein
MNVAANQRRRSGRLLPPGAFSNANLLDDIPKVVGMYPLYFRGWSAGGFGTPNPQRGWLISCGIHINAPGKATDCSRGQPSAGVWGKAGVCEPRRALTGLFAPDFAPRVMFRHPAGVVTVTNASAGMSAPFSVRKVEFTSRPQNQPWPSFRNPFPTGMRVNCKSVPLLRVNHAFQALKFRKGISM